MTKGDVDIFCLFSVCVNSKFAGFADNYYNYCNDCVAYVCCSAGTISSMGCAGGTVFHTNAYPPPLQVRAPDNKHQMAPPVCNVRSAAV